MRTTTSSSQGSGEPTLGPVRTSRFNGLKRLVPVFCGVSIGLSFYAYAFVWKHGSEQLDFEPRWYNLMAQGEPAGNPLNYRVLVPFLARVIALLTHMDTVTVFHILTPVLLLSCILVTWILMRGAHLPLIYQTTALTVFGTHLGVIYGEAPIWVDPGLLLITGLFVLCIQRIQVLAALFLVSLAALTKEYGILLLLPWAVIAYKSHRKLVWLGVFPISLSLFIAFFFRNDFDAFEYANNSGFFWSSLLFYPRILMTLGPIRFLQTMMVQCWLVCWPLLLLAVLQFFRSYREKRLSMVGNAFGAMLASSPILLMGDITRSLHLIEPFAFVTAGSWPTAANRYFAFVVISGVLTAATIRAGWSDIVYPVRVILYSLLAIQTLLVGLMLVGLLPKRQAILTEKLA